MIRTVQHVQCVHVKSWGTQCAAWANRTGLCPRHAGHAPRGAKTDNPFTTDRARAIERRKWAKRRVG